MVIILISYSTGATDCSGRCNLLTANNTITCEAQCPINTYVNATNNYPVTLYVSQGQDALVQMIV